MTRGHAPVSEATAVAAIRRSDALRVLLVVDSLSGGGAERHVVDLALALRRRGHDVAVACSASGVLAPLLDDGGIAVNCVADREVKRRPSLDYAGALRDLLGQRPVDVVHAHIYASAFAAAVAVATARRPVPLVVTEHTEAPWRSAADRALSAWTYRRAGHVVAVSGAIERLLRIDYDVPGSKVTFLLPAVPDTTPTACPPLRPRPPGAPLIGRVGRLQPEKGVDVFLRAASHVAAGCPSAQFLVVGDGPLRRELVELARRLHLDDRVEFCGFRSDARALICGLDVLVVSSHTDGSPLVVLEAMGAGVPVVATSVGGIPDQVQHGVEGLLVQPGDPAGMAAATLQVLGDPEAARSMGEAGRRRAATLGHEGMVERVVRIYRQAIGDRPAVVDGRPSGIDRRVRRVETGSRSPTC